MVNNYSQVIYEAVRAGYAESPTALFASGIRLRNEQQLAGSGPALQLPVRL